MTHTEELSLVLGDRTKDQAIQDVTTIMSWYKISVAEVTAMLIGQMTHTEWELLQEIQKAKASCDQLLGVNEDLEKIQGALDALFRIAGKSPVKCNACGELVSPQFIVNGNQYDTGGDTICARCHLEGCPEDVGLAPLALAQCRTDQDHSR